VGNCQALLRQLKKRIEGYIWLVILSTGVLKVGSDSLPAVHLELRTELNPYVYH